MKLSEGLKHFLNDKKDVGLMAIKGRVVTFLMVLIINSLYMSYYFYRDGYISWFEIIGLPIMLTFAWWFGKQYDIAIYYSEKDILTTLYNRRFVEKYISSQKDQNFALLLLDVNDFKVINDVYGHKAGDQYLMTIAAQLKKSVKEKDILARWGGDEFLIITLGTKKKENLAEMIDKIHQNLKDVSPVELEISVSIGAALYPSEGKTFDDLLKLADMNMYSMKALKHG
ncbi:diguanylate cyclase [Neobacillus sp. SAB-20_R2A]|uniref:diguanylate cyclase n=1 Tax=Neobacillus sp. SAB-20_R2A TaxID=3120519 RepID=UPI003C6E07F7